MRRRLTNLTLAALAAVSPVAPAMAQTPRPPTEVSPLTVSPPGTPPKLSGGFPSDGAAIAPGALILKLTFDQRMDPGRFDVGPAPGADAPRCLKTPRLLNDQRTFVLLCSTRGAATYALRLNGASEGGFANLAGQRAETVDLRFTTTTGEPVRSMDEAMKAAGLSGLDVPIQEMP